MYEGRHCRYLRLDRDDNVQRQMGTRTIEEFALGMMTDAANPDQLDALAVQLGHCAARCRVAKSGEAFARRWDDVAALARAEAEAARARLAAQPSRDTHPGYYDNRPATPPGHLDSDLFLPLAIRVHLDRDEMIHAMYTPPLVNGQVYGVGKTQLGKTWLTNPATGRAFQISTGIMRGLIAMGRAEAVPLSAVKMAA